MRIIEDNYIVGASWYLYPSKKNFIKENVKFYGYFDAKRKSGFAYSDSEVKGKIPLILILCNMYENFLAIKEIPATEKHELSYSVQFVVGSKIATVGSILNDEDVIAQLADEGKDISNMVGDVDFSSDMLLSKGELIEIIKLIKAKMRYLEIHHNVDFKNIIDVQNDDVLEELQDLHIYDGFANDFIDDPKLMKSIACYQIKKSKTPAYIVIGGILIAVGTYGYSTIRASVDAKYYQEMQQKMLLKQKAEEEEKLKQEHEAFVLDLKTKNASEVLYAVIHLRSKYIPRYQGWNLVNISYTSNKKNQISLTYMRSNIGSISRLNSLYEKLGAQSLSVGSNASVATFDIGYQQSNKYSEGISVDNYNNKKLRRMYSVQLIAALQEHYVSYKLNDLVQKKSGTVREISIGGDGMTELFQVLQASVKNPFFMINTIDISVDENINYTWKILGEIYE